MPSYGESFVEARSVWRRYVNFDIIDTNLCASIGSSIGWHQSANRYSSMGTVKRDKI